MLPLIRQTEPGLCLAACVAMVSGSSLDEVVAACTLRKLPGRKHRFLPDHEAIRYLATRHLHCGLRIRPPALVHGNMESFTITIRLDDAPGILSVKSANHEDLLHAVVWCPDRQMVLDPLHDTPQPLGWYELVEWGVVSEI